MNRHCRPNGLINEKSPYLHQHAYNPVDWYPWGSEAFAKARAEDKPIFLSIGYSTCHWCHVMERESFEDEEVADFLNRHFVSIKVDREERPDVDQIYMTVCQAMTGGGGWPLTVIMTPDKKPFFAGTYFPKSSKWGRPGIMDVLRTIQREWGKDREKIIEHAERITCSLNKQQPEVPAGILTAEVLDTCFKQLERDFDSEYGGFGRAPKFPIPHNLVFLMRYWWRTGNKKAMAMAEKTLDAMHKGGIYDHLGFGFARYSTDEKWLIPHFEKMLYDNALLCYTYAEAYQCTKNKDFARVSREIIDYVLRDMTSPDGGFYSAEDADSEGVEGKFYVWTREEILGVLGVEDGTLFCECYDVTDKGNFEHANILNRINKDVRVIASRYNIGPAEIENCLERGRAKLYAAREKRLHPFKDDKILTAWNGLMIAALAKAGRIFDCPEYGVQAQKALNFIEKKLIRKDGRLLARYRDGEAAHLAYLEDYAFLLWAIVELYETVQEPELLAKATFLCCEMIRLFWDETKGGFFFYGSDGEELIVRPKELYDGAVPSGNSVAAYAMLRLARLTDSRKIEAKVERMFRVFASEAGRHPRAYTFFLTAFDAYLTPPRHIVVAGVRNDIATAEMLRAAYKHYLPDTLIMLSDPAWVAAGDTAPIIKDKLPIGGKTAVYICENFTCRSPIQDMKEYKDFLACISKDLK